MQGELQISWLNTGRVEQFLRTGQKLFASRSRNFFVGLGNGLRSIAVTA
jgi:hypothetical protein